MEGWRVYSLVIFILFTLITQSVQQDTMKLDNKPIVFTLFEGQKTPLRFDENQLICIDAGENATGPIVRSKVNYVSTDPTTNCANCFNVWPDSGQYFLRYVPGSQKLDYDVENTYTINVQCEDANGITSEDSVEVRVLPNARPTFGNLPRSRIVKQAINLGPGALIHEVLASDSENDNLEYQLDTLPTSSNFAIRRNGEKNGEIYTVNGFEGLCSGPSSFEFLVRVKDAFHEFSDPESIILNIEYPSPPSIGNANREVIIEENVEKNIHIFNGVSGTISIDSVQPSIMRNKVKMFGGNILKVNEQFDFEEFNTANVTLQVKSGTCEAKFWLLIRVQNMNDLPVLTPETISAFVSEGQISYDPSFKVTDQDFSDTKVFTIERAISGTRDLTSDFQIDKNGVITSNFDFDLDSRGSEKETILFTIRATDKDGGFDESDVTLIVENVNDNPPVITTSSIKIENIMDCDPVQEIATISAVDEDTGDNGKVQFKGSGSGILSVNADGAVFLTSQVTAGTIYELNVVAEDLGNPSLASVKPVTITVIGQACTTLPPPTTVVIVTVDNNNNNNNNNDNNNDNNNNNGNNNGNNDNNNNAATTGQTNNSTSLFDDDTNLIWIIFLGLLGLLLLALLAWLLWRFCFPRCCPGFCGSRDPNALGRNTGSTGCCGRANKPVGPTHQEHYPEGKVKDFWQEHYQEMDYNDTSHRTKVPHSGYHEDGYLNPR
ncbi:hypothetical protein LOTGIDRAFT_237870 [Lottia gigantea]|uniref:Cadherin domain-containing protein n=1 Tax=Lottia gigantea TaxID=225164 RepID=V4AYF6_LOTGI|nr:hypothetical protein LOTGIDRAFT_237870 [Lottia gigantea]ESP02628.1 hypothetical protein LOTGIDRAFT_237870 [Lottia gigantea]